MFQVGDEVYIEDSAQIDINFMAWLYIKDHRIARIRAKMTAPEMGVRLLDGAVYTPDYAVEWPEPFERGHDCYHNCLNGHGQFINEKHMSLNFENSREVQTVPNL